MHPRPGRGSFSVKLDGRLPFFRIHVSVTRKGDIHFMAATSKRVRILRIGDAADEAGYNLTMTLNGAQDYYEFYDDDGVLALPDSLAGKDIVSSEALRAFVFAECQRRFPDDYPIGITDVCLDNEYSSAFDTDAAIISTGARAHAAPNYSLQRYLLFHVVDILMTRHIDFTLHTKRVGCVSDYVNELAEMELSIERCEFCAACRRKILGAVTAGRMSLAQVASILRLLDLAAERRRCFVLMPFDSAFATVYSRCVKPAVSAFDWECVRADEIFQTRDVMSIVWEEILRSDLIVADLTGRNPNVYYELGFAHASAKNTILLAQDIRDVPFDLRHRQLVEYSTSVNGYAALRRSIKRYLE